MHPELIIKLREEVDGGGTGGKFSVMEHNGSLLQLPEIRILLP